MHGVCVKYISVVCENMIPLVVGLMDFKTLQSQKIKGRSSDHTGRSPGQCLKFYCTKFGHLMCFIVVAVYINSSNLAYFDL